MSSMLPRSDYTKTLTLLWYQGNAELTTACLDSVRIPINLQKGPLQRASHPRYRRRHRYDYTPCCNCSRTTRNKEQPITSITIQFNIIGIGRCIAHELAGLGATVVIAARKMEPLKTVQDEIQKLGGICDTMLLNIRDATMASQVIQDIVTKHGKLSGLVVSKPFSFSPLSSSLLVLLEKLLI